VSEFIGTFPFTVIDASGDGGTADSSVGSDDDGAQDGGRGWADLEEDDQG